MMAPRRKSPQELSEQELRRLLLDKRRVSRNERLERFRQTGRALNLTPDLPANALESLPIQPGIQTEETPRPTPRSTRRRWADRILFGVEALAILGLAGILFNGMGLLRTLNQEVVASWKSATPEPTPLITAVVLPAGHLSPQDSSQSQENWDEIPSYLQDTARAFENLPIPTTGPEGATNISIPAIQVDSPIVQGDNLEQLRKGVGQHLGTPNPGQPGNLVLAGHNDISGEVFRYLDRLKPGDAIIIFTTTRQYVYNVTGTRIVEPTQVDVMAPTKNATLTLISCYPYLVDNKRIVVSATLQNP
jgi:sortase A